MSGSKTEKPTQKKLRDAAQKGQMFKSRDFIVTCLMLVGVFYLVNVQSVFELLTAWRIIVEGDGDYNVQSYVFLMVVIGLKLFLPFLMLCIFSSALPSLLQTGFLLATKALKLNFSSLNPVNGVKKIFSLRTFKDALKSVLYLSSFIVATIILWNDKKRLLFSQINAQPAQLLVVLGELLSSFLVICLGCIVLIIVLDALAEYFLHIKDNKMEKTEVKKENKEQDGNPEVKSMRRSLHMEILSEQDKSDVEKSQVIIANPTHIAVGIYFNQEIVPIPFISLLETNQKALAIRMYAKKVGVPVVEDIKLARRIFATHKRYSFVSLDELDHVMRLLVWLHQVENSWGDENQVP